MQYQNDNKSEVENFCCYTCLALTVPRPYKGEVADY